MSRKKQEESIWRGKRKGAEKEMEEEEEKNMTKKKEEMMEEEKIEKIMHGEQ